MSLDVLLNRLPPPSSPSYVGGAQEWHEANARLGFKLPNDYIEVVSKYGAGCIGGFIHLLNPFVENEFTNLFAVSTQILSALRLLRSEFKMLLPHPVFPERDGLFPWGITDNGDELFWLVGSSTGHSVVVCDSRAANWFDFRLSTCEFLAGILVGEVHVPCFPGDFPGGQATFQTTM